jgi:CRISPR-associated protein Cmr1
VEGKGGRTRETGLIGSLRWWYEAILRGSGFCACDPSSGTCLYDEKNEFEGICLGCQLFGCTGYSRRFRLEVEGGGGTGEPVPIRLANPGSAQHRGWRVPNSITNPFTLKILPLFPEGMDGGGLALTLRFIERYGALGAKASHGQGVVRITGVPEPPHVADWIGGLQKRVKKNAPRSQVHMPDLLEFRGVTIDLPSEKTWWRSLRVRDADLRPFSLSEASKWVPTAPTVRSILRAELRASDISTNDRHRLMGTIQRWGDPHPRNDGGTRRDRTKGSDIFVTHAYRTDGRWRMRIFGFIPRNGGVADQRIRELLGDAEELKKKVAAALGVKQSEIGAVTQYPSTVEALLAG